jgi:minor extracellular serine protease Vpr
MQACSQVQSTTPTSGKVVILERGECDFDTKLDAIALAGAAGVIVGNTADEYMVVRRKSPSSSLMPVASVPQSTFKMLLSLLSSGHQVLVQHKSQYDVTRLPSFESMDPSSSKGPTLDGRVKPDLVAAGTLQAAQSATQCGVTWKSGASPCVCAVHVETLSFR